MPPPPYKPLPNFDVSMLPDHYEYNKVNAVLDPSTTAINRIDQDSNNKATNETSSNAQLDMANLEPSRPLLSNHKYTVIILFEKSIV